MSLLVQCLPYAALSVTSRPINDRTGYDLKGASTGCRCLLTGNNKVGQICSSEIRKMRGRINGSLILDGSKMCLFDTEKHKAAV